MAGVERWWRIGCESCRLVEDIRENFRGLCLSSRVSRSERSCLCVLVLATLVYMIRPLYRFSRSALFEKYLSNEAGRRFIVITE